MILLLHFLFIFCFNREDISLTLETVFHQLSTHLKLCQKCSTAHRIFNSLLGVWISQWNTVSLVWYTYEKCLQVRTVSVCTPYLSHTRNPKISWMSKSNHCFPGCQQAVSISWLRVYHSTWLCWITCKFIKIKYYVELPRE